MIRGWSLEERRGAAHYVKILEVAFQEGEQRWTALREGQVLAEAVEEFGERILDECEEVLRR